MEIERIIDPPVLPSTTGGEEVAKVPMTPEMLEYFRQCGSRGGKAQKKKYGKRKLSEWGTKGMKKAKQTVTPAQRRRYAKKAAKAKHQKEEAINNESAH